jgi:hypothetical protein
VNLAVFPPPPLVPVRHHGPPGLFLLSSSRQIFPVNGGHVMPCSKVGGVTLASHFEHFFWLCHLRLRRVLLDAAVPWSDEWASDQVKCMMMELYYASIVYYMDPLVFVYY